MEILNMALDQGRKTLSESESKNILKSYGIPVSREIEVTDRQGFDSALRDIGFPLVIKACSHNITHKTEQGLVRLDIRDEREAGDAFNAILSDIKSDGGTVLVQEMINGARELVVGFVRDAQFGPCVMFGLGGIFTEIIKDVSFRVAPLAKEDALDMMGDIKAKKILDSVRGMPPADMEELSDILVKLGSLGIEQKCISEIDINPLIISDRGAVAADALIVLNQGS